MYYNRHELMYYNRHELCAWWYYFLCNCSKLYLILFVLCHALSSTLDKTVLNSLGTWRLFFRLVLFMLFQSFIDSHAGLGKSFVSFFLSFFSLLFKKSFPIKVKADHSFCTFMILIFTKLVCALITCTKKQWLTTSEWWDTACWLVFCW